MPGEEQLLAQAGGGGGGFDISSAVGSGLESIGSFIEFLSGGEQREADLEATRLQNKLRSLTLEQRRQLTSLLGSGTTIGAGKKLQLSALHRQGLSGTFDRLLSRAGTGGSLTSPERQRMFTRQALPLEAGFMERLETLDLRQLQQLRLLLGS